MPAEPPAARAHSAVDYQPLIQTATVQISPSAVGIRVQAPAWGLREVCLMVKRSLGAVLACVWLALRWMLGPHQISAVDGYWLAFLFGALGWFIASLGRAIQGTGRPMVIDTGPGMLVVRDPLRFRPRWVAADDVLFIGVKRSLLAGGHQLIIMRRKSGIMFLFPGRWQRIIVAHAKTRESLEAAAQAIAEALGTPGRPWKASPWWNW